MTSGKVLVFGDDNRSFLAIVRSLGRRRLVVHAAPTNFRSSALRSRYITAIHSLPPWMGDGSEWLTGVMALLRAERPDLVIPCNETSLLPLHRYRAELSQFTRLAIPDETSIRALFDKHETRELAKRQGVPVPRGRVLRPDDTPERLFAEFGTPVVIKPRQSYSLEALAVRGQVEILEEQTHLERILNEREPHDTLVEQFFAGQGVGVSVLASRGHILQFFEHHRVNEVAGASFYRFSAPLTPDLGRACEAIIGATKYTGLAMFEFKLSAAGAWALMEVNARPWGSMPLPVALGVDFPYRWYRLLSEGEETSPVSYRAGVYGRNLIPDLQNSLIEAKRRELGRVATVWLVIRRVAEMRHLLGGREVNDVFVRDDLRPAILELVNCTGLIYRRVARAFPGAALRRRRRALARLVKAMRKSVGEPQIVFVCQGNICRSPFAEALLRARLGHSGSTLGSAGMIPHPGRQTPDFGVKAALDYGIDLSSHRSIWLSPQMAEPATLLFVFDDVTRNAVLDRYPNFETRTILLGDLVGLGQIADPVDGDLTKFKEIYAQINAAISALTPLLRSTATPVASAAHG